MSVEKVVVTKSYTYDFAPSAKRTLPPGRAYFVSAKVAKDICDTGFGHMFDDGQTEGDGGRKSSATSSLLVEGSLAEAKKLSLAIGEATAEIDLQPGASDVLAANLAKAITEAKLGVNARIDSKAPSTVLLRAAKTGEQGNDLTLVITPPVEGLKLAAQPFTGGSGAD